MGGAKVSILVREVRWRERGREGRRDREEEGGAEERRERDRGEEGGREK